MVAQQRKFILVDTYCKWTVADFLLPGKTSPILSRTLLQVSITDAIEKLENLIRNPENPCSVISRLKTKKLSLQYDFPNPTRGNTHYDPLTNLSNIVGLFQLGKKFKEKGIWSVNDMLMVC